MVSTVYEGVSRRMIENFAKLNTEQQNPNTLDIDRIPTEEMLIKINAEDRKVAEVVYQQIPAIAKLIDQTYACVENGGRILYVGAGTSGRLGILDASECPPTYGVSDQLVQGVIAGGTPAIFKAQEGAEDSKELAVEDLKERNLSSADMVIGLAASGRTPYVIGALEYANQIGAQTGSVCCVEHSELAKVAHYPVEVVTGAEVVTGSTRMKAGTAQKMVLNMISTCVMIKMGKVYHNLMVDVQPSNEKLIVRATRMIQQILEVDSQTASDLFEASGRSVKRAIVMHALHCDCDAAQEKIEQAKGVLANII